MVQSPASGMPGDKNYEVYGSLLIDPVRDIEVARL